LRGLPERLIYSLGVGDVLKGRLALAGSNDRLGRVIVNLAGKICSYQKDEYRSHHEGDPSERIRFLIQKQQRVTLFADTGRGLN